MKQDRFHFVSPGMLQNRISSSLRILVTDSNVVHCSAVGCTPVAGTYQPWYAGRFSSIENLIDYWKDNYQPLRQATEKFSRAFYDTTLPPEVVEAVASNLCDSEVADGPSADRWPPMGMGGSQRDARILLRIIHACVELCSGNCAFFSRT